MFANCQSSFSWLIATFLGALPLPPVNHWNIMNAYHVPCMNTHGIQAQLTAHSSTRRCVVLQPVKNSTG